MWCGSWARVEWAPHIVCEINPAIALKQVACQNTDEGNEALREAKTLQGLSHHNVVRYNDVFLHMDASYRYAQ